ncbi:universal stress protein [Aquihabitans sp. McL0605]|uniref:universal stress protein n=1 Tax=Aquihabitans sp. McL0605 TaxID=3415671 RepID=UPI003CEDFD96
MSTVLLATDGSDLATAAMAQGIAILGHDHTFITLAVVTPAFVPTASVSPMDTHPTLVDPVLEKELEDEQRATSDSEIHELDAALGITAEHLVKTGEPGPTICDVAADTGANVVVIGTHGHGWFKRVMMGSVSTHVLHHAPCPVLVIRTAETHD